MAKDMMARQSPDEFLVQHLVDPTDWVSDNERTLCNVCTRQFSTFRRKHHCRMCGEIVCSNCTLLKSALLPTVGYTRVRVCVSCVFKHSQKPLQYSPRAEDTLSMSMPTEESREWLNSHLHSPLSKSDDGDYDTEDYGSTDSFEGGSNNSSFDNQQQSPQYKSPGRRGDNNSCSSSSAANQYEFQYHQTPGFRQQPQRGNNQQDATASSSSPMPRSETRSASPSSSASWAHPWPKPPVAADETSRLQALYGLGVLDSGPEKPYDMICDLAKARLSCPMAAVSFMDEHRQWFKASVGLAHKMIPRKIAFCAYTVFTKEPVVVLDTLKDKRFEYNPLVSGAAAVRFYAAAPILDPSTGHAVGSVFVLDTRPRESCDVTILERLAHAASDNLPQKSVETPEKQIGYARPAPISPAPSTSSLLSQQFPVSAAASPVSAIALPVSAAASPVAVVPSTTSSAIAKSTSLVSPLPQTMTMSPLSTMLTTTVGSGGNNNNNSSSSGTAAVASGEQMEVLLMRLLTQNTETQQQLATQQMSISSTLGFHSTQISKLMTDFARMEAKIEAKIK